MNSDAATVAGRGNAFADEVAPQIRWRIEVDLKDKNASLWSVTFLMQIAVAGV